jgi:hypothetical protein
MGTPTSHSATPGHGWSQYVVKVGDFNNDGRADLAWGRVLTTNNTYISLSIGDGTFEEMPMFTKGPASVGWGTHYQFEVGNIDGKDGDDLIWNVLIGTNRTYVSFSNGDGTFGIDNYEPTTGMFQDHPLVAWTGNEAFAVADINGNGRDDLIWYTQGINVHHVYVAESVGDVPGSVFSFKSRFDRGSGGWTSYKAVIGNIDGNAGADMVWVNPLGAESIPVHRNLSTGLTPAFVAGSLQWIARAGGPYDWQMRLLDVNGDGRKDLLANSLGTLNHVVIGLGKANGDFDFSRISQDHPAGDQWPQFQILTGDINGDSREDVIYVNADATNTVYVGIARGSAQ